MPLHPPHPMKRNRPILPAYESCETFCFTCRHAFLLFFFLFNFSISKSQRQPIKFEHVGTSLGLSQSNVICIYQDSRGRIWFATDGKGISMMQNGQFTYYNDKNQLKDDRIYSITEDKKGNIIFSLLSERKKKTVIKILFVAFFMPASQI